VENIEAFADDERLYKLVLDARWGERYCDLHARMYGHIRTAMNISQGAAGSAAFAGYFVNYPGLIASTGIFMAVLAVISGAIDFSARAIRFELHGQRYGELDAKARAMSVDEFSSRVRALQNEPLEGEVNALRHVAMNDVLRENGRGEEMKPLTLGQRVVAAIA